LFTVHFCWGPDDTDRSRSKSSSQDNKQDDASNMAEPAAQTFLFRELAVATNNFRPECLLGEGGFGKVYKGCLESTGQVISRSISLFIEVVMLTKIGRDRLFSRYFSQIKVKYMVIISSEIKSHDF